MSVGQVDLVCGPSAHLILGDPRFLEDWRRLYDACPHATAFQAPSFVRTWYRAYEATWQPVIVRAQDPEDRLVGLWCLAHDSDRKEVANAGAHQAEYQSWLALPGEDAAFLSAAWTELRRHLTFASLRFKYLPSVQLGRTLQSIGGIGHHIILRRHRRPLLNLDPDGVRASFAKKRYKSRFTRLKKLGALRFERITDPAELERVLEDLIAYYDFRQGAVNRSVPFREDPQKRRFHRDLFADAESGTYVTATYLAGRPIAAFWGMLSGEMLHLAMLIHSPFLAEYSLGKLHIMQLSEHLLGEGLHVIDLTPGGDPWKDRFANTNDEVAEAILYRSVWARRRANAEDRLLHWAKRSLSQVGVAPATAKTTLANLRRARPSVLARKISSWITTRRELRVYRSDRAHASGHHPDGRVNCNSLSDLLSFEPAESSETRDAFLLSALTRLGRGETAYTISMDSRLAHSGWMVKQTESYMTEVKQSMTFPLGSVALYDFYSHPEFRGRGLYRATIGHMLHDAFADERVNYAYISVLADDIPSRHVIETMGFEYQGSFFWERHFGVERKWAPSRSPVR